MANKRDLPQVTPFSQSFGAALAQVMERRGVTRAAVARAIGKKAGAAFVSERLRGLRAVDTDVIAGVALVAGVDVRTIVRETLALMPKPRTLDVGDDSLHVVRDVPADN